MGRKIATCCYCGTRAVLVLDEGRHELACGACGAPLHDMKMMPVSRDNAQERKGAPRGAQPGKKVDMRRDGRPVAPRPDWKGDAGPDRPKRRGKRKRKPILGRVLDEVWDVLEDIID
ncbi:MULTISPECIES: hypothetical protein [Roseovarius]|uniref:hypothetical protein n=1 Tax=Roseovarius TaxID=74030 RepID=UPI000CDD9F99|nr:MULTISPECIES: hypothetical protein [Roseovarius]